jgi:hypothetical protein
MDTVINIRNVVKAVHIILEELVSSRSENKELIVNNHIDLMT